MLTDTAIKRATPGERDYKMADSGGLFLLVTAAGGKLWRWKYRFDGKEKKMAFGQYPDVPLVVARSLHAEARRLLASGVNPMEQRRAEKATAKGRNELPFRQVAAQWHDHWKAANSAHHVKATWSRLETNVFPLLGSRPITEIKPSEVVAVLKSIQVQGKLDIAKRALETMKQIFRYAIAHDLAEQNPAGDIKPADVLISRAKVNHARVEAKELPALLRAIEVYQGKHVTRLAMKLLAMTFVRTSELIGARWEEINFENARWDIPAQRMKMRTPHTVPLATQALGVLEHLKLLSGNGEMLFPGERDAKKQMSNNTILFALKRMGYGGTMTGHGFRGLASTILHEMGWNHEWIELQLAHAARNAVSAAYNHALYLEPRAKMMQHWADFLEATQRSGKVLPFRAGAARALPAPRGTFRRRNRKAGSLPA